MKIGHIFCLLILFALSLHAEEQSKAINKKDLAIKAAKITGYAIGFAVSTKWLLYAYDDTQSRNESFIYGLLCKPLQEAWNDPKTRNDHLSIASGHYAILGCFGYSTYGLYTELNPAIKTLACWAQQKINALRKK